MSAPPPPPAMPMPPPTPPPPPPPLPDEHWAGRRDDWAPADTAKAASSPRRLCKMSIASLLEADRQTRGDPVDDDGPPTIVLSSSSSSSSPARDDTDIDSLPRTPLLQPRTPLSRVTQDTVHHLHPPPPAPRSILKRPAPPTSSESDLDEDSDQTLRINGSASSNGGSEDSDDERVTASGSDSDSDDDRPIWRVSDASRRSPHLLSHGTSASARAPAGTTMSKSKAKKAKRSPERPSPRTRGTLVVYQPTCLDHHNDTHQESRQRLSVLCGPDGVLQQPRFRSLAWANLRDLRPVRMTDMLRVHAFEYIQHLERMCASLPPQDKAYTVGALYHEPNETIPSPRTTAAKGANKTKSSSASSPSMANRDVLEHNSWMTSKHAQRCYEIDNPPSGGHFDSDSPISERSYLAARLAAGAVCHAIDKVVRRETRNAFVVVRPPGHHAGPNGCVESQGFHRRPEMCTCGFCLLNNVAIGAAYAMNAYSSAYYHRPSSQLSAPPSTPAIQRVAIVDFDIHHGNGTEEILRNLVPHEQRYPLPSSWAPRMFASYRPWRDERDLDNVFFASIHLHDGDDFYPGSGKGPRGDSDELRAQPNILNLPLAFLGPKYLEDREKLSVKAKRALMREASRVFRNRVTRDLLPALRSFRPDLLLLSAGFDGHADDFYYYLTEDDYGWMTTQLTAVADECCDGRLVSVLEGGYNVDASPKQKRKAHTPFHLAAQLHGRDLDDALSGFGSLARSCAAHVAALEEAGTGDKSSSD